MSSRLEALKAFVRWAGSLFFGQTPSVHRIPFGPIKGRYLFISFDISPRMYFGIDEPWIAELARQYVKPNDVIYDIGTHIGYTLVLFAHYLDSTGEIHAFEILPSTTEFLKKTIVANGFNNVVIHNVGLGSEDQILELPIGKTVMTSMYSTAKNGEKTQICTVVPLDKYVSQNEIPLPSLLKIDIEGAEIDCLKGALNLIKRCLPLMIIEFHSKELLKEGFSVLKPLGYRLVTRAEGIGDEKEMQKLDRFPQNILCVAA